MNCPMCGGEGCGGHAVAGVEIKGDREAVMVRFRVLFGGGYTFCAALPALEAVGLASEIMRSVCEAWGKPIGGAARK